MTSRGVWNKKRDGILQRKNNATIVRLAKDKRKVWEDGSVHGTTCLMSDDRSMTRRTRNCACTRQQTKRFSWVVKTPSAKQHNS